MYDPIHPGFYHFWSSALVGLLGYLSICLISSVSQSTDLRGCGTSISLRQFYLLLVLAVWTHIIADVIEHGYLPRIGWGLQGLSDYLRSLLWMGIPPVV
ncbi:hypothetical protein ACOZ4L_06060 [Haloplanus ruber]|uniref:Metal-dependent hydrolase n=1 Tax=Haloplanus ruber TaxID=869892 RepID=A0ABD6CSV5_9EURY|nr:hypothetical protein [Haloplanus ruber]